MKFGLVILGAICALLSAPASDASPLNDYKGADGGWLVMSITAARAKLTLLPSYPPTTSFAVNVSAAGGGMRGGFAIAPIPLFGESDASGALNGHLQQLFQATSAGAETTAETYDTRVIVWRMAPGAYQIDSIQLRGVVGRMSYTSTYNRHAVAFRIQPGRTLYLGALTAVPQDRGRTILGVPAFDYWRLLIDNESARDLPIAERRSPGLGPVDSFTQAAPVTEASGRMSEAGTGAPAPSATGAADRDAANPNASATISRF